MDLNDSLLITTSAAVAVAKAIEKLANEDVKIKWVNDLYMNDRKVCGILTEASLNVENGGLEYAVVGIGINVTTKDFPDDIRDTAGAIFSNIPENKPVKSILAAEVLNNLSASMDDLTNRSYLLEYKNRSFLIDKEILVLKGNDVLPAKALDIDERARLIVEYSDGTREALSSVKLA